MMRVSTFTMYRAGEQNISKRQSELLTVQQQLSSGKRISSPSDDPIGAADGATIRTSLAQFGQFKENQDHAKYLLSLGESTLNSFIDALQSTRERLIQAGNSSLSNSDRASIASDLESKLAQMTGLANSVDGAGGYLFAGSIEGAPPFAQTGTTVSYRGDQVLQKLEVTSGRFLNVKSSGDDVFLKIRPGNGTFTTAATATNTGSGVITVGAVTNYSALTTSAYTITTTIAAGVTTYTVVRASDNTVRATGTYTSPTEIEFDGMRVGLSGTPANNDSFTVQQPGYKSVFDMMSDAISMLRSSVSNDAQLAQFSTKLGNSLASIEQATDRILVKRGEIGAALSELDSYQQTNDERQVQYEGRLSAVEDLDYAKGISELTRRQTTFQAAIQSYSLVSKLSLFNYL